MRAYFRILSQLTLSLIIVVPLGMLLFPGALRAQKAPASQCQSHLKQIALGLQQYTQDYDERFPTVKGSHHYGEYSNPWGWADALQPYLKSTEIYHCPSNPQYKNKHRNAVPHTWGYIDYFYNQNMSGRNMAQIDRPVLTLLLGDGNDGTGGTSARYSLNALPQKWRNDKKSPSNRHNGGAYYAFADGHVKWHRFNTITTRPVREGRPTFAIKLKTATEPPKPYRGN